MWPFRERRAKVDLEAVLEAVLAAGKNLAAEPEESPGKRGWRSSEFVYPDYVDREALTALAEAKGIVIDPAEVGTSLAITEGTSVSSEVSAAVVTPVSQVGTRTAREFSHDQTVGQSISVQRRQSVRWMVDEITGVLRREGVLREDLALVPEEYGNEVRLINASMTAELEWGLQKGQQVQESPTEVDTPERGEEAESADVGLEETGLPRPDETAQWHPQSPTPSQLALALETVSFTAGDVVRVGILARTRRTLADVERTLFSLTTLRWGYWAEGDDPHLWNGGILTPEPPHDLEYGPPHIKIPIDPAKLSPLARERYRHREYQALQVFAKIERVDSNIVLTPIVILSA
jgi:hypothetical protein